MLSVFRSKTKTNKTKKAEESRPAASGPAVKPPQRPSNRSQPVTDQTLDYLKGADPDDILELMLPGLVQEQQRRLVSTAKELEEIDQKLAKLYTSRDDVYSVMNKAQGNGTNDF